MKKFLILICATLFLFSCGKKESENLSRKDIAMLSYQMIVLNDDSLDNLIDDIQRNLVQKMSSGDQNAELQLEMWRKEMDRARAFKRSFSIWKEVEYPKLNATFGNEKNGVAAAYRLEERRSEDTGKKVLIDVFTDKPFTGLAIDYNLEGKVKLVADVQKGKIENIILENKFYSNGNYREQRYYKDGNLYKIRYYNEKGVFKKEKKVS